MRRGWIMLLAAGATSAVPGRVPPTPVRLVQCAPHRNVPCLEVGVALTQGDRGRLAVMDSTAERQQWSGALGSTRLIGPGMRPMARPGPRNHILLVIDRSAQLSGAGIAFTRIALKAFVQSLDSNTTRFVVAAVDSASGTSGVTRGPFMSARQALAALDTLSAPEADTRGDLKGALVSVASRMQPLSAGSDSTQDAAVVITGGIALAPTMVTPRPRHGRHPTTPLAATVVPPDSLIAKVLAAVSAAGPRVWIIQLDTMAAIPDLPAASGHVNVVRLPLDPNALAHALARVRRALFDGRLLLFGVPAEDVSMLAHGMRTGMAVNADSTAAAVVIPLLWRPPVFALPAYQGIADTGMLSPDMRDALLPGDAGEGNTALIALFLAVVLTATWLLVPRLAWARPLVAPVAAGRNVSTTRLAALAREAEPRRPEDITHQTARRTAMHR